MTDQQLQEGWVAALDTNERGRKVLTLLKALAMAKAGGSAGWYIAPFATEWTVGRVAHDGERYHILRGNGEPISFCDRKEAARFVGKLLVLTRDSAPASRRADAFASRVESVEAWGPELLQRYS